MTCTIRVAKTKETVTLKPGDVLHIGRKEKPDCLSLVLPYPDVSSSHAEIRQGASGWVVVDLGSTNKTRIFGNFIEPGVEHKLSFGDALEIGPHRLLVLVPEFSKPVIEFEEEIPQQDLTGIAMITATILKVSMLGRINDEVQSLNEGVYSKHPILLFLLADIVSSMRRWDSGLPFYGAEGCTACWTSRIYYTSDENTYLDSVTQAGRCALELKKIVGEFHQHLQSPLPFDLNVLTTVSTFRAAINVRQPDILLDSAAERMTLEVDALTVEKNSIVSDEATYKYAHDFFQFEAINQEVDGEQTPTGLYYLRDYPQPKD